MNNLKQCPLCGRAECERKYVEIAQKLWTYIRIIDDTHAAYKATYEELADAIRLTDDERELYRRLDNADA